MDDKNLRYQTDNYENNSDKKTWKTIGTVALAIVLAVLTVVVINL